MHQNLCGEKDTWAVYFSHLIFRSGYSCITPTISLTKNIGFDNPTNTVDRIKQSNPIGSVPSIDVGVLSWVIRSIMLGYHFGQKLATKIRSFFNADFRKRNVDIIDQKSLLVEAIKLANFPISMGCTAKSKHSDIFVDQIWAKSDTNGVYQLANLVELDLLYAEQHDAGVVGNIWMQHHKKFRSLFVQE